MLLEHQIGFSLLYPLFQNTRHFFSTKSTHVSQLIPKGHDPSAFYEGGLEKGGFSKLNLRKVRRRRGGGGADEHRLEKGLEGGFEKGGFSREGGLEKGLEGGLEKGLEGGLEKGGP